MYFFLSCMYVSVCLCVHKLTYCRLGKMTKQPQMLGIKSLFFENSLNFIKYINSIVEKCILSQPWVLQTVSSCCSFLGIKLKHGL